MRLVRLKAWYTIEEESEIAEGDKATIAVLLIHTIRILRSQTSFYTSPWVTSLSVTLPSRSESLRVIPHVCRSFEPIFELCLWIVIATV